MARRFAPTKKGVSTFVFGSRSEIRRYSRPHSRSETNHAGFSFIQYFQRNAKRLSLHVMAVLSLAFFSSTADAITVPYLSGPVVDEANLLSHEDANTIRKHLDVLNQSGKVQMAVLTVETLQGETVESFAITVADQWKLGTKGKDQGVLFLIAPKDRRMRIEVGRGLEGDIPDVKAKRILSDQVAPLFKEKRYRDGILLAVWTISDLLDITPSNTREVISVPKRQKAVSLPPILFIPLVLGLIIFVWFYAIFQSFTQSKFRRRYRSNNPYWPDNSWNSHHSSRGGWGSSWGGGSGGGFSGGGGGFSGGGASSSW